MDLNRQSEEIINNIRELKNLGMKDKEIVKTVKQSLKDSVTGKKDIKFVQDMVVEALKLIKEEQLENQKMTSARQKELAQSLVGFANAYARVEKVTLSSVQNQREQLPVEKKLLGFLSRTQLSLEELSQLLNIPVQAVEDEIKGLIGKAYEISESNGLYALTKQAKKINPKELLLPVYESRVRIGVVGDTHGGSIYEQLTYLHEIYDIFAARDVNVVFHVGDISAGVKRYDDEEYHKQCIVKAGSRNIHNGNVQTDWIAKNYPKRKDMKTYVIAGDFDETHMKHGYNIVKAISAVRDDIEDLGIGKATINFENGLKIELLHPNKTQAYAITYRQQKINEGKGRKKDLPHAILYGHTHTMTMLPYGGIFDITCGCFEGQPKKFEDDGKDPAIGGLILDLKVKDGKLQYSPMPEFISFNEEIKEDWKNF